MCAILHGNLVLFAAGRAISLADQPRARCALPLPVDPSEAGLGDRGRLVADFAEKLMIEPTT
jgi:hypothetical protein